MSLRTCPLCGITASANGGNMARHRRGAPHSAAVAALGHDPTVRPSGVPAMTPEQFAERFWSRVDKSAGADQCWPWTGSRQPDGYGTLSWRGRSLVASRVALELSLGRDLGKGFYACHTCDNPPCCNPAHLFSGTHSENLADLRDKGMMPAGEAKPNAKLNEDAIREIRRLAPTTARDTLAARFGVSEATIRDIVVRKKWRHVA